jgi:hypothetical protein
VKDGRIDKQEWGGLKSFLGQDKRHERQFFTGDSLNEEKLRAYIRHYAAGLRPPLTRLQFPEAQEKPLSLLFYLERSGSMEAYDAPGCKGEFKSAIVDLLNHFPAGEGHDNLVYVVNDGVYDYPGSYNDFIKNTNIFASTRGIGNPQWTDFAAIFDSVLVRSQGDRLNILVSDLIYSPKSAVGVNVNKLFGEAKGLTSNVFHPYVEKGIGTVVLKMRASYDGKYYPYDSPNRGLIYRGDRPYYFVIVGDNKALKRIFTEPEYRAFSDFGKLNGFEDEYAFMPDATSPLPFYSIVVGSKDNKGTFRLQKDVNPADRAIAIDNLKPDRNSGDCRLSVAMDLSGVIADGAYKCNPANYHIESADSFRILGITPLTQAMKDAADPHVRKYLGSATHLMLLQTGGITQNQTVKLSLLNHIPDWIRASSTDDDRKLQAADFPSTTFALKYLMQGIYDAYYPVGQPSYARFELSIHK